ncbi:DUF998 domain-containing protein [Micromonospora sp. DT81.3]|uniref:DUF998 domain-containing protein n=1 Tax=Micromonospora sp. DT81.3 TaxID=3416523 RepID=UPI003CF9169E
MGKKDRSALSIWGWAAVAWGPSGARATTIDSPKGIPKVALIAEAPPYITWRVSPIVAVMRRTSPTQAVAAAAGVLVAGILVSIVTTPDPHWWQLHFSRLGTFRSFSGYSFNATIVAASVMLVLFAVRLRIEMRRHAGTSVLTSRRAAHVVPALVALIGLHLSLVGFAPLNVNLFIHERGSSGAVLSFASLLASSRWMLRGMHRLVTLATRGVGVALVFWGVFFGVGVINLAAFEFIVFSLMFAWLVVVTRQLGVTSEERSRSAKSTADDEAPCPTVIGPRSTDAHVVCPALTLGLEARHSRLHSPWRPAALPDRRRRAYQHAAAARPPREVSVHERHKGRHGRPDQSVDHHGRERLGHKPRCSVELIARA